MLKRKVRIVDGVAAFTCELSTTPSTIQSIQHKHCPMAGRPSTGLTRTDSRQESGRCPGSAVSMSDVAAQSIDAGYELSVLGLSRPQQARLPRHAIDSSISQLRLRSHSSALPH